MILPYPVYIQPPIQIKGEIIMFEDLFDDIIKEEPESITSTSADDIWDTEQYWYVPPDNVWNVSS
jgi:hypothetical protein